MEKARTPLKEHLKKQEGFTLLEIIAVIVIMSILAVVAVPKYFDLQDKAREKAFGAGISEAIGRINGYFAEQVLSGVRPASIDYTTLDDGNDADMGDFTITVNEGAPGSTNVEIQVDGKNEMAGLRSTIILSRPGGP